MRTCKEMINEFRMFSDEVKPFVIFLMKEAQREILNECIITAEESLIDNPDAIPDRLRKINIK